MYKLTIMACSREVDQDKWLSTLEISLQCTVCLTVKIKINETLCCKQMLCQECLPKLKGCPVCRRSIIASQDNIPIRRLIEQMFSHCEKCDKWIGKQIYNNHATNCGVSMILPSNPERELDLVNRRLAVIVGHTVRTERNRMARVIRAYRRQIARLEREIRAIEAPKREIFPYAWSNPESYGVWQQRQRQESNRMMHAYEIARLEEEMNTIESPEREIMNGQILYEEWQQRQRQEALQNYSNEM